MKKLDEKIEELKYSIKKDIEESVLPDFTYEKRKLLELCPEFLLDLSSDYNLIIAGGMITSVFCGREVSDIDLYLTRKQDVFPLVTELLDNATVVSVTDKSLMVNHSGTLINVILFKVFDSVEDIFNSFDFTVCMGAFDLSSEQFVLHRDFLKHNSQRILKFNPNTDFPIMSLVRTKKYKDKGYSVSKFEFVRIAIACTKLEIKTYDDVEKHIGGMYGIKLSDIMDVNAEFNIDSVIEALSDPYSEKDKTAALTLTYDEEHKKIKELLSVFAPDNVKKCKIGRDWCVVYPSGRISSMSKYIDQDRLEEHDGKILMYKFVKKTDDPSCFESFYRSSFKYKIGEKVVDESHGIHCGSLQEKSSFTYSDNKDKVLIELEVNTKDIIKLSSSYSKTTVKKAKVVRVMTEEYLNNEELNV